jgi:putative phosphoribosyl transferase
MKGLDDELNGNRYNNISDIPELRNRTGIFLDREHAGMVLSQMLISYKGSDAVVLGIPAGGVPVAAPIALKLGLDLDVAVVSKITLPWNTEAGYGAVAFDGTVQLNQEIVSRMGLTLDEIQKGTEKVSLKVERRFREFRGDKSFPDIKKRPALLVDDGIASGFTMLVAVEALKKRGASRIVIAVPTAHLQALEKVAPKVSEIYCANIRGGWGFAVADAYQNWYDVDDEEVSAILKEFY